MKHCPTFNTECGSPLTCCNGCYANPVEQRNSDGSEADPLKWWQTAGGVGHFIALILAGVAVGVVLFSIGLWFAIR